MRSKRVLLAVIALCVITLYPISSFAQNGTDCRRRKDPPGKGVLDLTDDWMDNSVSLKVHIIQIGGNLNGSAEVIANYEVPYKCAYPAAAGMSSGFSNAVMLNEDFTGQLTNSTIEGEVYICQSETETVSDLTYPKGIPTESNPRTKTVSVRVAGKLKDMTVSEDGNTIHGTFKDPSKGTLKISFTRLPSKPDKYSYQDDGRIRTTEYTQIYRQPSSDSIHAYSVPAGTQFIFDFVKPDVNGLHVWYHVTNFEGGVGAEYRKSVVDGSGLQYSANVGWIMATSITCDKPSGVF